MIIELNATPQQIEMINKYTNETKINLSDKLLESIMAIIEDYEDTQKVLKSIEKSKGKPNISFKELCKQTGVNYEDL